MIPEIERWKRFAPPWRTLGPHMAAAVAAAVRGEPQELASANRTRPSYRRPRATGPYIRQPADRTFSGQALRDRRIAAKYSQGGLAYLVGTSQGRISSWELGRNFPASTTVPDLAQILGCLPSDLAHASPE